MRSLVDLINGLKLPDGVAALLGAVIGGLISVVGNWFVWRWQRKDEALRWLREDATRFHAERRTAYARYLSLVRSTYSDIANGEATTGRLLELPQALADLHAEISLIASVSVRETADALSVLIATAATNPELFQGRDDVRERFNLLENEFRDSARSELGTPETIDKQRQGAIDGTPRKR